MTFCARVWSILSPQSSRLVREGTYSGESLCERLWKINRARLLTEPRRTPNEDPADAEAK